MIEVSSFESLEPAHPESLVTPKRLAGIWPVFYLGSLVTPTHLGPLEPFGCKIPNFLEVKGLFRYVAIKKNCWQATLDHKQNWSDMKSVSIWPASARKIRRISGYDTGHWIKHFFTEKTWWSMLDFWKLLKVKCPLVLKIVMSNV